MASSKQIIKTDESMISSNRFICICTYVYAVCVLRYRLSVLLDILEQNNNEGKKYRARDMYFYISIYISMVCNSFSLSLSPSNLHIQLKKWNA